MSKINDGGLAFGEFHKAGDLEAKTGGMSLRDYFAAKAMQASRSRNSTYDSWEDLAADAYEIADAMLAAREVAK